MRGKRKGIRVIPLARENVGDRCLERRCEGSRCRLKQRNQYIDLPYLVDERQRDGDGCADEIQRDEKGAPRHKVRDPARQQSDHDIGGHLDRERGSEHRTGIFSRQIVGKQRQRDRHQPRADKGHDLGREKMPVGPVLQNVEHART